MPGNSKTHSKREGKLSVLASPSKEVRTLLNTWSSTPCPPLKQIIQCRLAKNNSLYVLHLLVPSFCLGKTAPECSSPDLYTTSTKPFQNPYRLKQKQTVLWELPRHFLWSYQHLHLLHYFSHRWKPACIYTALSQPNMDDRTQSKLLFPFLFLAITEMNRTLTYRIIFTLALHQHPSVEQFLNQSLSKSGK